MNAEKIPRFIPTHTRSLSIYTYLYSYVTLADYVLQALEGAPPQEFVQRKQCYALSGPMLNQVYTVPALRKTLPISTSFLACRFSTTFSIFNEFGVPFWVPFGIILHTFGMLFLSIVFRCLLYRLWMPF